MHKHRRGHAKHHIPSLFSASHSEELKDVHHEKHDKHPVHLFGKKKLGK